MSQGHLDTITSTVIVGGQPLGGVIVDFSKIVIVDVLAVSGSLGSPQTGMTNVTVGGNSSKLALISESDDLTAAPFVGGIGAAAKAVIRKTFAAAAHPSSVYLLSIDIVGTDSWANIWTALKSVYTDVYAAFLVTDVVANIADAVEGLSATGDHLIFAGFNDPAVAGVANATWVANDIGTLTAAQKNVLFLTYHDQNSPDGTAADFAEYAARYLTSPFLDKCPGGNQILQAQPALASISSTERANLRLNNINFVNPYFSTQTYMDPGVVQSGIGIYSVSTSHLLRNETRNALASLKLSFASRMEKFPLNSTGQALGVAALQGRVDRLVEAQHLMTSSDVKALQDIAKPAPFVKALTITDADRTAGRLRFEILQYSLLDARAFSITTYLEV